MHPLDPLFRPLASMINRQIRAKTPARELCEELEGRVIALRVTDTALAAYLVAEDGTILISGEHASDPDVVMSGSLLTLARLAGPAGEDLLRDGEVDISGDALVAQSFRKLLRYGQPDLEEELSGVIGDVAAHSVGEFVRDVGDWARSARDTMRQNVSEYLEEESRVVPGSHEVDEFRDNVERLRDDAERLEARIGKLERDTA